MWKYSETSVDSKHCIDEDYFGNGRVELKVDNNIR